MNKNNFLVRYKPFIYQILLPIALTSLSFLAFVSTGRDDAYITYGMADSIFKGNLNGYNDVPHEQTSSILHAFLISLFMRLGSGNLVLSAKVLEIVTSLSLNIYAFKLISSRKNLNQAAFGLIVLSILPHFAYWSWGGLENSLYIFLSLALVVAIQKFSKELNYKSLVILFISNFLILLVRPETIIILPLLYLSIYLFNLFKGIHYSLSYYKQLISSFLLPIGIILTVRFFIFNRFLPATVYAKRLWNDNLLMRIKDGLVYVASFGLAGDDGNFNLMIVFAPIIIFLFAFGWIQFLKTDSNIGRFSFVIAFLQLILCVISGGDWMAMGRFLVAPLYLVIFSLILNTKRNNLNILLVMGFLSSSSFHFVSMTRLVRASYMNLSNLIYFPLFRLSRLEKNIIIKGHKFNNKYSRCNTMELTNYIHLRDCVFLDAFLEAANKGKIDINKGDIVMSKQAGLVMYNLKKEFPSLRFIDIVGLASGERLDNPIFRKYNGILISKSMVLEFINEYNPKFIFDLNSERLKKWLHKAEYENVLNTEVIDSLTGKSVTQSLFMKKK